MDLEQTAIADETVQDDEIADETGHDDGIADELLIEEISIDGMCGVY